MSIRVTVTDTESGDTETKTIDNDVLVIVTGSCYVAGIADYPTTGTQVYTIKGRRQMPTSADHAEPEASDTTEAGL